MPSLLILKNFRIIDESADMEGSLVVKDGRIDAVIPSEADFPDSVLVDRELQRAERGAAVVIDGNHFPGGRPVLMPAFVDLHAHFRESGFPPEEAGPLAETLESASLAAAAGGYGTVVCMANTKPVIDTPEAAASLKNRADALGLIDLYPVLSLTKNMEGRELSGITGLKPNGQASPRSPGGPSYFPRLLSEDGRDVADDTLLLAAFAEARRLGLPVSCHCDAGGPGAAKKAGQPREVRSRAGENNAVRRAIALGREAGCHVHIAHVSAQEAVEFIRETKKERGKKTPVSAPTPQGPHFFLTCEATPHHLALTEEDARRLGAESHGRVNPPLRTGEDRLALIAAIRDGTIDAIATDHAPHTRADKAAGAPGFTGLETAFGVCFTELVREYGGGRNDPAGRPGALSLSGLSSLMSAAPARILGLGGPGPEGRGRIAPGFRADLTIADTGAVRTVDPGSCKSRGRNSPFAGRELRGSILMTIRGGRVVFDASGAGPGNR
jgi:dihydroorotase